MTATTTRRSMTVAMAVIGLLLTLPVAGCAGTTRAGSSQETAADAPTSAERTSVPTTAGGEVVGSYTDGTASIEVTRVTTGAGDDTITYYVADVLLRSEAMLQSAFAGGTFGGEAEDTSDIAAANGAVLAVNGDYYGARDDGIVIREGVIYRDEPVRTGLALYTDGTMRVYDETETSAQELLAGGVWNTYSFGPALLIDGRLGDALDTYEVEADARHGVQGMNPRTGIGWIESGHYVLVVVDGRNAGYSRGVTLEEFAQIFAGLGCTTAYNLDGGGSATMYFQGEVVNEPSQKRGERAVSDILLVG